MRFAWLGAGAALALVIVGIGCSHSKPDDGKVSSSRQAIQGGTTDTEHTFAVGVCGDFNQQACAYRCSGALITPNLVVTARHCVQQSPEEVRCDQNPTFGGQQAPSFHITTSTTMPGSSRYGVKQIIVPPDSHVCGNDIALLILSSLVPASEAHPIVPGVQYDMGDPRYGNLFTAIGYGATDPSGGGTGTRRIKQQIQLLCIPGDQYIPCPPEAAINPNEFVGGDGTCQGDSGSSAYEQKSFNKDVTTAVSWGVLSRGGVSQDGTACVGSIYTRLDKWRDLVINAANQASNNWTLYPKPVPDWTGPFVPLPTKDAGTKDSGSKPSGGLGLGEACDNDAQCASKTCAQLESGNVCSAACDDSSQCADGFTCQDNLCLVAPADNGGAKASPKNDSSSSGCSVALDPEPAGWRWLAFGAAALVVGAVRRRRRS
jgi:MYXO-CTERM domain-containing protein